MEHRAKKAMVRLTSGQLETLDRILQTDSPPVPMRHRAAILLRTDAGGPDG